MSLTCVMVHEEIKFKNKLRQQTRIFSSCSKILKDVIIGYICGKVLGICVSGSEEDDV